jgi:dTMP kinase
MADRGKFITLEGIEGTGKTTQCALLCDYLRGHGIDVVETREPGGTSLGEEIRRLLLSPEGEGPGIEAELLLFLAARAQLVKQVIVPSIEAGKWVICDRFSDATLAYQGYGRGIDPEAVRKINEVAVGGIRPDKTILLDLDVETGIRRAVAGKAEFSSSKSGDRMEKEDKAFHRRVREGYRLLAGQDPGRIVMVSVTGSIEDVHGVVVSHIDPLLAKKK